MLTLKLLRDDPEYVIRKLAVKNFDARTIVEDIIRLDANRRSMQAESDALASQQKQKAALIGGLMKEGRKEEAEQAKQEVAALKARTRGQTGPPAQYSVRPGPQRQRRRG